MAFTLTYDNPGVALIFWTGAAVTSAERVLSVSPRGQLDSVKAGDAAVMLLALRNVLRAAEWTANDLPAPACADDGPRHWVAEFKRLLPGLVNARDILEHFDDYADGRGRLQRSGPEQYHFTYSVEDGEPIVAVGRFSLQVRLARDACRWLFIKLTTAIVESGYTDAKNEELDEVLKDSDE